MIRPSKETLDCLMIQQSPPFWWWQNYKPWEQIISIIARD